MSARIVDEETAHLQPAMAPRRLAPGTAIDGSWLRAIAVLILLASWWAVAAAKIFDPGMRSHAISR